MSDTELIDSIERYGIQTWPMLSVSRKEPGGTRMGGEILNWTAQNPKPFFQVTRASWRAAVTDLLEKFEVQKELI